MLASPCNVSAILNTGHGITFAKPSCSSILKRDFREELVVLLLEHYSLNRETIVLDERGGPTGAAILHGGEDMAGGQCLDGARGPGGQKRVIVAFTIVGCRVSSVIPFGNHDGENALESCLHGRACICNMLCPVG